MMDNRKPHSLYRTAVLLKGMILMGVVIQQLIIWVIRWRDRLVKRVEVIHGLAIKEYVTWHHEPNRVGILQLVPTEQHTASGPIQSVLHPNGRGGMQNWGGGRRRKK